MKRVNGQTWITSLLVLGVDAVPATIDRGKLNYRWGSSQLDIYVRFFWIALMLKRPRVLRLVFNRTKIEALERVWELCNLSCQSSVVYVLIMLYVFIEWLSNRGLFNSFFVVVDITVRTQNSIRIISKEINYYICFILSLKPMFSPPIYTKNVVAKSILTHFSCVKCLATQNKCA